MFNVVNVVSTNTGWRLGYDLALFVCLICIADAWSMKWISQPSNLNDTKLTTRVTSMVPYLNLNRTWGTMLPQLFISYIDHRGCACRKFIQISQKV